MAEPDTQAEIGHPAVLSRFEALDTDAKAPQALADDDALLRGTFAVLPEIARCRTLTRSRAHWVQLEWRVDAAGAVERVLVLPVFIPAPGAAPALAEATLQCIEKRALRARFEGRAIGAPARVRALVGFELVDVVDGAPPDFTPEEDGRCREPAFECKPRKMCSAPEVVPCPRVPYPAARPSSSIPPPPPPTAPPPPPPDTPPPKKPPARR